MQKQPELIKGIGLLALIASCFNCTVGGGIFRLPATVFGIAGTLSPLVYVLCFLTMLLVAGVFIEVGRTIRVSGGPYAYVKPVLGEYPGFVCGVLLWFLAVFAFAAVGSAYAHFVALLLPLESTPILEGAILIASLTGLALFNTMGVKSGARVSLALAVIKILPLILLCVVGIPHLNAEALTLPAQWDSTQLARGAMVLIFAFTGVESALIPSGEIKNPGKNLPKALIFSAFLVLFLYLGVQAVSQSTLGAGLGEKGIAPLTLAAIQLMGPIGGWILGLGAVLSTLGYLSAMTLNLPRSILAFAENGYLPKFLGEISPTTHVPVKAIWAQTLVVIALTLSNGFEKLAVLANLSAILMYILCSIAAVMLLKKEGKLTFGKLLIPVGATLAMAFLLTSVTMEEWLSVLSLIAGCSIIYRFR